MPMEPTALHVNLKEASNGYQDQLVAVAGWWHSIPDPNYCPRNINVPMGINVLVILVF